MTIFANHLSIKVMLGLAISLFVYTATAQQQTTNASTDQLDVSLIDATLDVREPEPEEVFTPEEFLEFNNTVSTDDPNLTTQRESEQTNQQHSSKVLVAKFETRKQLKEAKAEMLTLKLDKLAAKDEVLMQRKADVEAKLQKPNLTDERREKLEARLAIIEQKQVTNAEKEVLVTERLVKVEARVQHLEEKLADLTNNTL